MSTKFCRKCNQDKPLEKWGKHGSTKDGLQSYCCDCRNAARREARRAKRGCYANEYTNYRMQHLEICRKRHHRHKSIVFQHYCPDGVKCSLCGFNDVRALSIDHKNGDGAEHRKALGGKSFYLWLIQNDFPGNFQVLCMNCQFIKRHEENEYREWNPDTIHPYRRQVVPPNDP